MAFFENTNLWVKDSRSNAATPPQYDLKTTEHIQFHLISFQGIFRIVTSLGFRMAWRAKWYYEQRD